jgi:hypothetical protein
VSQNKTTNFTLRLSPEDRALLDTLRATLSLDRASVIRHLVRQAARRTLSRSGHFVTPDGVSFPIRLREGDSHD